MAKTNPITEIWKKVFDYPDYSVSNLGRIRSDVDHQHTKNAGRVLCPWPTPGGYLIIRLTKDSVRRKIAMHHIVLLSFGFMRPSPKHCTNHKNGIRDDNRLENLEWVTYQENNRHALDVLHAYRANGDRSGARTHPEKWRRGENHPFHLLTEKQVIEIRTSHIKYKVTYKQFAEKFHVSWYVVRAAARRITWKHI